jgi:hypothetical protein
MLLNAVSSSFKLNWKDGPAIILKLNFSDPILVPY